MSTAYDTDFYAWTNEQAALLRAGQLPSADIENIAEEMESMGRSEKRELSNRIAVLLSHLLKWQFQPNHQSASWRNTIRTQRLDILDVLDDNPSLKSQLDATMIKSYRKAILTAADESGLPEKAFPLQCAWTFSQAMNESFWPS